ncbi:MFS general substrate transporter [Teratosphaeria nubilosa]|uniref:MFS general substrate transporter n=1 Tax=Teratosphaeria nubilosa TaxID=161662 RepID=A0A6G1LGF2_9PEZI|nr:MFS general substrate transporter [Teratosphaeria nubilosa]
MVDDKVPEVSTFPADHPHHRERRLSLASSIGAGFETQNIFGVDKPKEQNHADGLHPHGSATTYRNEGLDSYYRPRDEWEGLHRYDTEFTWEPSEESALVRKLDWKIAAYACLMFFALQLDRGNISQALSDNMLKDLGMTTNEYNYGQTIFYLSFLCAELPSQMISKRLGPDRWIPVQMVSWSLVASMQCFLSGRRSFYACRSLLGLIEGGFIPDTILYLSYYYTSTELPKRLGWFWVAYQSTSIVSAFLAYGILHLRGVNGLAGWRWLFALEGCLTGLIGILSWFYLPASPYTTASWFRGKDGWFTVHEEKIIANRIIRDDPSKGDMHNREALSLPMLWRCLKDWHMWPIYLIGLSWTIPNHPQTQYLTLQLKALGFGTFRTNLLTIPAYVLFILQLLFWTWLSEKLNQRFLLGVLGQLWSLPLLITLEVIPTATSHWGKYACSILLVGFPYIHAILVAITSRNAGTVRTRTVASALYNMCVQTSSIVASEIYRADDAPMYRRGNKVLIGICVYNIFLFVGAKVFYVWTNSKRERLWNAMTKEERERYLETTKDKGNKRLDFRFAH